MKDDYSGFVVLSIDCLLVETIQQFIDGVTDGQGKSKKLSKKFLKGPRFQPDFDTDETRLDFYSDIRCGLLHQAEAKNKWLIRRKQGTLLKKVDPDGYIIDVERFSRGDTRQSRRLPRPDLSAKELEATGKTLD